MITRCVFLVLVTAFTVAACSDDSSTVATVNGEPIHSAQVIELRDSFSESTNVDAEEFRLDLTPLIHIEAQSQAAAEQWGIEAPTHVQIEAKVADPAPQEQALFDQVAAVPDRNEATIRAVAAQLVIRDEVARKLLSEEPFLVGVWETNPYGLIEVCARHVLVATEEEAVAAKAAIVGGEDFAAVAMEQSLDTGSGASGGELQCTGAAAYVPEFAEAAVVTPIGEVSEPFETQFGWHIVVVDERTGPASLDELLATPIDDLPLELANEAYSAWLTAVMADADVVVVSKVGRWDPAGAGSILPPP